MKRVIPVLNPPPLDETGEDAQLEKEVASVYEWCVSDGHISTTVDCKCLADKFRNLRKERGPDA